MIVQGPSLKHLKIKLKKIDLQVIAERLAEYFADEPEKITYWLCTPNPHFGNIAPLMLIALDKGDKVANFIRATEFA